MSGTTLLNIIEDIENLEQVEERIFSLSFTATINNVEEDKLQHLDQSDREFVSMWRRSNQLPTEILDFTLPNQENIRYLVREAYVETSKRKSNMFGEDGTILPKEQRTVIETVQTIFIERTGRVYSILFTANITSTNKVKRLFGEHLKEIENEEGVNITDYRLDPDLFYWLFYKHENHNGLIEPRFEVESIAGFIGNIADETHTVTGTSDVTPSLLITKAFVSKYHPFKSLDVLLKYANYKLNFIFNDSSECYIRPSCSIPNLRIDKKIASSLIIYGFIIPRLFLLFNNDETWGDEATRTDFAKNIGKDVIKEIADFHELSLDEILN